MKSSVWCGLFLSVILHACTLMVLWFGISKPTGPHDFIEVAVVPASSQVNSHTPERGAGAQPIRPQVNLRRLLPGPYEAGRHAVGKTGGSTDSSDDDFESTFHALTTERYTPLMPFFQALWNRVDHNLEYPDDFVQQRIKGIVTVHLVLDSQGRFTGRFLKVSSQDPFLETYVLATLIHTLKEPLPERFWLKQKQMSVALTFDFRLYNFNDLRPKESVHHVKNALLFDRASFVEPKANQVIEKIFTRYIPPIIPIPGGFYVDFVLAYKMIAGIGKPDADELRLKRMGELRDQLQLVIKKNQTGT